MSKLEELALEIEKKGKLWIELKQVAERYDELKKVVLAEVQNGIELTNTGKELSEAKLKRLAEGSKIYRQHIESMCNAKRTANEAFTEYEAFKNLFDAERSNQAFERVKAGLL